MDLRELATQLQKILELRAENRGRGSPARRRFNQLQAHDGLPALTVEGSIGKMLSDEFDNDYLWFVEHDWETEYADVFIMDILHAIDPHNPSGEALLSRLESESPCP